MATRESITRIKLQKGRYLVKRGEVWYLETCLRNFQGRRSLGTGDLPEATRRAAQLEERDQKPLPKPKAPPGLTLARALEEYDEWYRKNCRETEVKQVLVVLRNFIERVGDSTETKEVTRDQVQRWVDGRVDGRSPVTVRWDFARVRAVLYWLARWRFAANMNACRGID